MAVEGDAFTLPLSRTSSIGEVLRHPVAGPIVQAAIAQMMGGLDQSVASIMPEGVDMSKMMESFPIGRIGMMGALGGDGAGIEPRDDRRPHRDGERRRRAAAGLTPATGCPGTGCAGAFVVSSGRWRQRGRVPHWRLILPAFARRSPLVLPAL